MVLLVAKDLRLFQKYNLDAEIVGHIPGAKAVFPLVSGDAQVVHAAGPPFVLSALGGSEVVMFMGLINTMSFYIVAHKDIATPAQLRGKRVGVSTLGSSSDFSLRYGLTKLGVDAEKDVTVLALGEARFASMRLSAARFKPALIVSARHSTSNSKATSNCSIGAHRRRIPTYGGGDDARISYAQSARACELHQGDRRVDGVDEKPQG